MLDTTSLRAWNRTKPRRRQVARAVRSLVAAVPAQWHDAIAHLSAMRRDAPEWLACAEALERIAAFDHDHGQAARWNMGDAEVCDLARRMAAEAQELDDLGQARGESLAMRLDTVRMLVQCAGLEPLAVRAESAIKRARCETWWRRALRVKVARVVEAGAQRLGVINVRGGAYASAAAIERRAGQLARNAAALARTYYRNEAGQVYSLAELAERSTANPVIRGGEMMLRIRGAEEYADAAGHVGLFVTLTCPSAFHPVRYGSGGRTEKNPRYDGKTTAREAQAWLRKQWARARSALARAGVKLYGVRVAEPHHDGCPHWHAMLWAATEEHAQAAESIIRRYWLAEYGDERGAEKNRVNVKRITAGGAAAYCAKYVAKSIGHHALPDHLDEAQGQVFSVETGDVPGFRRVDAWASTWGIRQFQFMGMPPVTVWRELRRVTSDQAQAARVAWRDGVTWSAWAASGARYLSGLDGLPCWKTYMRAMGGACAGAWALRVARRDEPGRVNRYGEEVGGRVVGVVAACGRWLISRRMAWTSVAARGDGTQGDGAKSEGRPEESGARSAAPWSGFNNCTARITGRLRAALVGGPGTAPAWRRGMYGVANGIGDRPGTLAGAAG